MAALSRRSSGARDLAGRHLGPVGVSVLGAAGHAAGQMLVAWLLLIRHDGIWSLFPFLLLFSLGTGIANGVAADLLLELLRAHPAFAGLSPPPAQEPAP
jgi:heptaprenyl diphosphate synthase